MTEPGFECEADVVGVDYGPEAPGEDIWLCRDSRCEVDPELGPQRCMAEEYYLENGGSHETKMEISIYDDPFFVQTEPIFLTLQRFESMIKVPWRIRLKSWWIRRRQPENVRAIVDLHSEELDRQILFGDRGEAQ